MRCLFLFILLCSSPMFAGAGVNFSLYHHNFYSYDYDDSTYWQGPGFYSGIWFDTAAEFYAYQNGDGYYYNAYPGSYVRYYYGTPYYYSRSSYGGPAFYFSIDRNRGYGGRGGHGGGGHRGGGGHGGRGGHH